MAKNIDDMNWSAGNWTVETWMHSTERPINANILAPIAADLQENKWHHIAVSKGSGMAQTYVNGEKIDENYTIEYETAEHFDRTYYVVKPRGMLGNRDFGWDDMVDWCVSSFGPSAGVWDSSDERWYCNNARFYFKNEKDRDWFAMRFS